MAPSDRLKRRAEFLAVAATGLRCATPAVVVQARAHHEARAPRFGFTATRKLGNAVVRNRARRRLRAAVRELAPKHAQPGHDYVLVARQDTTKRPWILLLDDVARALQRAPTQRGRQR